MRKQCLTQWDLKWNTSFSSQTVFWFSMVCWETGSVKWVHPACLVSQGDDSEAVLCSHFVNCWGSFIPWQQTANFPMCKGRLLAAVLCCHCPLWNALCWAGSAWKVLPWEQGGAFERLSSLLGCAVLSHSYSNQILLPPEEKWWVCHLPSHFRFLDIL